MIWNCKKTCRNGNLNAGNILDLFQCSNLQILHIELFYQDEDEVYKRFQTGFREHRVKDEFIEHAALDILLALPRVMELVFFEDVDSDAVEFKALGVYMTALLTARRAQGWLILGKAVLVDDQTNDGIAKYIAPSEEEILAIFKGVFNEPNEEVQGGTDFDSVMDTDRLLDEAV